MSRKERKRKDKRREENKEYKCTINSLPCGQYGRM
jgi:hypothetical protein